jgi:glycosyltransferase involved in cell wall biosynthesis
MNIAVISDISITYDGRVQRVVKSFLEKNLSVDLFLPVISKGDKEIFNSQNLRIITYDLKDSWLLRNLFFGKKFLNLESTLISQGKNYDFVYVNDYPLLEIGLKLKKQLKTKLIYDSHEIYVETINQFFPRKGLRSVYGFLLIFVNKIYHKQKEKKMIKQSDFVVTVCDSFKNYFQTQYNVDSSVIKNCPIENSKFFETDLIREKLNLDFKQKIILYQGMFTPGRGLEKLINASQYFDSTSQLVLLGSGPLLSELKAKAKDKNNIHFLPLVDNKELIKFISSADVGIVLIEAINKSKELTLPNKIFDYMAGGIPFVTNNLPEGSHIAKKHNCGFVIEDNDSKNIAFSINEILKCDYKKLGENGRVAINQYYLWHNDFDAFYKKLTTKH